MQVWSGMDGNIPLDFSTIRLRLGKGFRAVRNFHSRKQWDRLGIVLVVVPQSFTLLHVVEASVEDVPLVEEVHAVQAGTRVGNGFAFTFPVEHRSVEFLGLVDVVDGDF